MYSKDNLVIVYPNRRAILPMTLLSKQEIRLFRIFFKRTPIDKKYMK